MAVLLSAACASDDSIEVRDWNLVTADSERELSLPAHFERQLPDEVSEYRLRASVELPPEWRGRPLTFAIPYFAARADLRVGGTALRPALDTSHDVYRSAGPHSWALPVTVTGAAPNGRLDLELTVLHTWTRSGWLDTTPRLSADPRGDPTTNRVRRANNWICAAALGTLGTIAFTYFLLSLFEHRRRRTYAYFTVQTFFPTYYFLFILGISQEFTGNFDVAGVAISISGAVIAATYTTRAFFEMTAPSRAWLALAAIDLAAAATAIGDFKEMRLAATSAVVTLAFGLIYQVWLLAYLVRLRRDADSVLHLLSWICLAVTTPWDGAVWLGLGEPLGGVRLGPAGLALFALLQFVWLSRTLLVALARSDSLNVELTDKLELLQQRQRENETLNQELRRQVAERSRALSEALGRLSAGRGAGNLSPDDVVDERYRVVRELGAGAAGTVYEVRRMADDRRLAMKVLRETADTGQLARFAREAQLASEIDHPNVVTILDVGFSSSGFMFLVMEYVDGLSLRQCRDRFGDVSWALPILGEVAAGLQAIHDRGVVHRDLKPSNVLLAKTEAPGRFKAMISDFGIAGPTASSSETDLLSALRTDPLALGDEEGDESTPHRDLDATTSTLDLGHGSSQGSPRPPSGSRPDYGLALTQTGMIMGTPKYMAPELAGGHRNDAASADMFSFGVLAHESLASRYPFAEPPCVTRMQSRTVASPRALAGVESIPSAVGALVDRCLDMEPTKRPTAGELARALADAAEEIAVTSS